MYRRATYLDMILHHGYFIDMDMIILHYLLLPLRKKTFCNTPGAQVACCSTTVLFLFSIYSIQIGWINHRNIHNNFSRDRDTRNGQINIETQLKAFIFNLVRIFYTFSEFIDCPCIS